MKEIPSLDAPRDTKKNKNTLLRKSTIEKLMILKTRGAYLSEGAVIDEAIGRMFAEEEYKAGNKSVLTHFAVERKKR